MATSGTVSTVRYNANRVIEHACRRAGYQPEAVAPQDLLYCRDSIFTLTSQWINAGFPLWTRRYDILSAAIGQENVATLDGTVDAFAVYWRILMPYRGPATLTTGGDGSVLFGGEPNSDVTITGTDPGITVAFGSDTEVDTIGVLGGATAYTAALEVQTSQDGVTYSTIQTLPSKTIPAGAWSYQDLSPTIVAPFVRVIKPGATSWVVNQFNFGLANWQDILIGPLSMDDYYNQGNRAFRNNQPNSSYVDRQLLKPQIKIWPLLNTQGFYNGCITCLSRRYIQDPGALTDDIEVPQRWLEALQWRLASIAIMEFPIPAEVKVSALLMQERAQRIQLINAEAPKAEALAWAEERNRSPIRWLPDISPYTA